MLVLLALTSCSFTAEDPTYVPPAPLPPLAQLEQAPLVDPAGYVAGEDVLLFATEDRGIACSLTSARGNHINLPYETNTFGDAANNKLDTVPVAHCELAVYPPPAPADVRDDCAGTGLGYLGGVAVLQPVQATYGACRSGVTAMESERGPKGTGQGPISEAAVLPEGGNLERNGLRCTAYNGGVACGNVSAGVGFFISPERYELLSPSVPAAPGGSAETSKTP